MAENWGGGAIKRWVHKKFWQESFSIGYLRICWNWNITIRNDNVGNFRTLLLKGIVKWEYPICFHRNDEHLLIEVKMEFI